MISLITGKVMTKSESEAVLMTAGGVGYRIKTSPAALSSLTVGSEATLNTFLAVREDAMELFGFASVAEKCLFQNFRSVSGIGPKTALHLLSLGSVEEITLAVGRGDVDYLTKVSGIGKKTAERIVLELREKLKNQMGTGTTGMPAVSDALSDVIDGLITLGYSALEAREAAKKLDAKGKTSEQLLREALRAIK